MASENRTEYKVVADKIVSPDNNINFSVSGNVYIGAAEAGNRVATVSDIGEGGGLPTDFTNVASNIVPSQDNTYSLGTDQNRWKELFLGPGTIYITDSATGEDVAVSVSDGVFNVDGIAQAQLPVIVVNEVRFSDNTVQTTAGGGGSADIADFVFDTVGSPDYESTMTVTNNDMVIKTVVDTEASGNIRVESAQGVTVDANGDILIESKNGSDVVKARITLDQSNEQVLIEAIDPNNSFFDDTQWATAVWTGTAITITNTPDIINFFNNSPGTISDVSVNNGVLVTYQGASYGSENITIDVGGTPAEGEDPLTVTSIRFYYPIVSKIDINYDNGTFDIDARNMPIDMSSTAEIDITSGDDITINAGGDDLRLRAWDDITFIAGYNNGDQYEWRMNNNGRFELPASGYIENPNGASSDGNGLDTLHLVPDFEAIDAGTDQYIVIEPTAPNHIHIRAGGTIDASNAELILGGEDTHVKVSDTNGSITILANDITIASDVSPSTLNINTYSGAVINSNRTSAYADADKFVATLGDIGVETDFTVVGGASGTQPTFTGDPLFTGSYVKMSNNLVHFQIQVDMDNITNFGSGQYYVDLPFPAKHAYQVSDGCLHDISSGREYPVTGHVAAGESRLYLQSIDASGNSAFNIDFTATAPVTLATADNFHIAGTYIMQEGV